MLSLAIIRNFNVEDKYKDWKNNGGTLLNDKQMGCGINSMTFIGLFDRKEGIENLRNLNRNIGTPFSEIVSIIQHRDLFHLYEEKIIRIKDDENKEFAVSRTKLEVIVKELYNYIVNNSCTIIKFNRNPDITLRPERGKYLALGHTVIVGKIHSGMYIVDPQQEIIRQLCSNNNIYFIDNLVKDCNLQCYESISFLFTN